MILNRTNLAWVLLAISMAACKQTSQTADTKNIEKVTSKVEHKDMKSYISMFEIPATDIARAIKFYEALLGVNIEKMEVDGMEMGILPYEAQMVTGVIIKAEGYKPSANGITVYLHAGPNLEAALEKVQKNGGKIVTPKTAHADGSGHFAIFIDSEGNKMALNAPNL